MTVTATLTIDRTGLSLAPLVLDGADEAPWGLVTMSEPALLAQVAYAPPSQDIHGSTALSSRYEHANIAAAVRLEGATAAALRTMRNELRDALGQFSYSVTQTINGVSETYAADPGSVTLDGDLSYEDMRRHVGRYRVVIPVYPIGVPS